MSQSTKKALIILTSHTELGSTGRKTGFYYDEMATPYWRLIDAGFDVDIASVKGGIAPPDPKTLVEPNDRPPMVARFMSNDKAMAKLNNSYVLKELNGETYECVFLPGGHGTMWDFDTKDIGKIKSLQFTEIKDLVTYYQVSSKIEGISNNKIIYNISFNKEK